MEAIVAMLYNSYAACGHVANDIDDDKEHALSMPGVKIQLPY